MPVDHDFIGTGWAFPTAADRDRRHRAGRARARAGRGDAAHPADLPGRAADAARVRLPACATSCSAASTTRRPSELTAEVTPVAAALGATGRRRTQSTCTPDADSHELLFIDIQYAVKDTNDRRNLVFPFYTIPDDGSDY